MAEPGIIKGEQLVDLFNRLIIKKTIISMHVVGSGFEQLVTLSGVHLDLEASCLLIDRPRNFKGPETDSPVQVRFNFSGPDKLAYIFETIFGDDDGSVLRIPFPEYVERLQRRDNFRIAPPPGVRLMFGLEELQCALALMNISAGGALGLLFKHSRKNAAGPVIHTGQVISKITIEIPADRYQEKQMIRVEKAEVRRVERDRERKLYRYALEFTEIEKKEKKRLIQFIYRVQRQYLRRR
jgi:hypothetical protein